MPAEQDWLHLPDFEALLDLARKSSARDLEIDVTKNTDHHTCNASEAAAADVNGRAVIGIALAAVDGNGSAVATGAGTRVAR